MAEIIKSKHNSNWHEAKKISVKDGGVWKEAKKMFVYQGGEWKLVYNGPDQNLLSYANWNIGDSQVSQTSGNITYGLNGDGNKIISDTDPFGNTTAVWQTVNNDTTSNADGGWNTSNFPVDQTKMYRYSVWVKRPVHGDGHFYLGLYGKNSSNNNIGVRYRHSTSTTTNPYFEINGTWNEWGNNSDWYLVVGHVWPYGTGTGALHPDSGVYDTNGNKVADTEYDYVWLNSTTQGLHRTYLYYSTVSATDQRWVYPRVDKFDGTEPTVAQLVRKPEARSLKRSCKEWRDAGYTQSGMYGINPTGESGDEMAVYCDMETDGGGWTLMWSHMLNTSVYPAVDLLWNDAINTKPLISTGMSNVKNSFEVYTGLEYWNKIGGNQIMYEWATSGTTINQQAIMDGKVGDVSNDYKLQLTSCVNTIGTIQPGLYTYHNGRPFTSVDNDHDENNNNCADYYQQTPWWYGSCWSGSINGGGTESYSNGAFWTGSSTSVNASNGTGGGNGWIYVR